jgi:glycerol kinase
VNGFRVAVIDQGSSATKGAVFGEGLEVLAEDRIAIGVERDADRVEHDALEIASSVVSLLEELEGLAGPFTALGLAVQRSSCLLWDRESADPLSPVVSWQDRRHALAAERLGEPLAARVRETTGLFASPHYAALKLRGLLDRDPALRRRAERGEVIAGTLDAWLVHRLTGEPSTEPGLAGRTLLYDLERDEWSAELGAAFDIPSPALPPLRPSGGRRGAWRGVPLLALLGDQQAALLGHGGWRAGVVAAHFGTGAFVLASTGESILRHPGLLSAAIASVGGERRFQIEGAVQSAGSALDWMASRLGLDLEALESVELDPQALPTVVPAFVGLGAPWWRPRSRASIDGLELATSGADLLRGTIAGIAQRVADNVEAMREAGVEVEVLRLSGRLARRADLGRLVCELVRSRVEVAAEEESGLDGIARLAGAVSGERAWLEYVAPPKARYAPEWSEPRCREARALWHRALERHHPS